MPRGNKLCELLIVGTSNYFFDASDCYDGGGCLRHTNHLNLINHRLDN